MWRRVGLVRTEDSEAGVCCILSVERISVLGMSLAVNNKSSLSSLIRSTLKMEVIRSFETLVLTRSALHHITKNDFLCNHSREDKSYKLNAISIYFLPFSVWEFVTSTPSIGI
jgi:hypothetical protein